MPVAVAAPAPWAGLSRRVAQTLRRSLRRLGRSRPDVLVALVSTAQSAALNRRYRRRAAPANVLAFPVGPGAGGEIILCPPVAAREARRYGRTPREHLDALAIHGLLHLLNYRHDRPAPRRRMERLERRLLTTR